MASYNYKERTYIELNTFFCTWHKWDYLQGENPQIYLLYLLFINVCCCVSWFLIDWPKKGGSFFSGLWLWLHTFKSQDWVQKDVALVVKAEEQQWFSVDILFPIFCSSQIYTAVHVFLSDFTYVAEGLWMHFGVFRDSTHRYPGCAGMRLQRALLNFHVWELELLLPESSIREKIIWIAEIYKLVIHPVCLERQEAAFVYRIGDDYWLIML